MPQGVAKIKKNKSRDRWRNRSLPQSSYSVSYLKKKKKNSILSFWWEHHGICVLQHSFPPPQRLLHKKGELYTLKAFLKENLSVNTCGFVTLGERDERETIFILPLLYNL